MIVVDTSALMAMLKREPSAPAIAACLDQSVETQISASGYLELAIVTRRSGQPLDERSLDRLLVELNVAVASIDLEQAREAVRADARFGKGSGHPAQLNYGDCFAYALAKVRNAPLLYVGGDFAKTDIAAALA